MITVCPVCKSTHLDFVFPDFSGTCITSDMEILPNARIANRLCRDCGLIFNAAGTRGATQAFYRDSYSLMTKSQQASIQSFTGPKPMSQAEKTFDLLCRFVDLPASGVVLEAGAGKGEFLGHFTKAYPDWRVYAFEPSQSYDYLVKNIPKVQARRCDYGDYDLLADTPASSDLVVALGVLEHVESPLDMLVWANGQLCDGGLFYIRVPNFARNPNDLFCADHLSKLTIPSLISLAAAGGFEVDAVEEGGVPVFMLLRKICTPTHKLINAWTENQPLVEQGVKVAKGLSDSIQRCRNAAHAGGEPFAIFGMASAGLAAPFMANFDAAEIAAYIDENKSVWGNQVHGRPVGGLDLIAQKGIRHVALSISPIYFDQVKAKLEPLGVQVYTA